MASLQSPNSVSALPDPLVGPLRDVRYLARLIAEVSSAPLTDVERRLASERRQPGISVRQAAESAGLPPNVWCEGLVEFYRRTDAFLYETAVWNSHPLKGQLRRWIAERLARWQPAPLRLLAYGDGLGFDSLYFRQAGHRVSYLEISQLCRRFARRIFRDQGADVEILESSEAVEAGAYDVVTCLDVLEHVPDPVEMVTQMVAALRPGGLLITSAPFWLLGPNFPTHLASNRRFSGDLKRLYGPHRLRLIDGRLMWDPLVLERPGGRPAPVTWATRLRIQAGSLVLKLAGWCPWPFVAATNYALRRRPADAASRTTVS